MEENVSICCRICLNTNTNNTSLLDIVFDDSSETFLDIFNLLTKLDADMDDELPKKICSGCENDLKIVFDVRKRALDADKTLRQCFELQNAGLVEDYEICDDKQKDAIHVKHEVWEFEYADAAIKEDEANEDDLKQEELEDDFDEEEEESLEKEENSGDDKPNLFKCEFCDSKFTNAVEWEDHVKKQHKKRRANLCNICGKTYCHKMTLESHLLQHKGEKAFQCRFCEKSYCSKSGLQAHLHVHSERTKPSSKFLCSICGRSFATNQRLNVHTLMHTGEKKYQCSVCPKKFGTIFRLKTHTRIHTGERPFECPECGLKFAQSNALKCHLRRHTGEKPYECKICGKRFNQNTILKTHMTLHTGKKVKCPLCDKKFSRPSYLILHQRDHTGEKPYACHACPNRYKQKSHLDRHLDTHMGIKHKCEDCGKEYSKKSSLNIHRYEHADRKPYQCDDCLESFARRDKYKNHIKKFHNKVLVNGKAVSCDVEDFRPAEDGDQIIVEVRGPDGDEEQELFDEYITENVLTDSTFCKEGTNIEDEMKYGIAI